MFSNTYLGMIGMILACECGYRGTCLGTDNDSWGCDLLPQHRWHYRSMYVQSYRVPPSTVGVHARYPSGEAVNY